MDPEKGRLFWRSYGSTVASATPSLVWMAPTPVDCSGDRVCCYFSTWVVHLKVQSMEGKEGKMPSFLSWCRLGNSLQCRPLLFVVDAEK